MKAGIAAYSLIIILTFAEALAAEIKWEVVPQQTKLQIAASLALKRVITNHPRWKLRKELNQWIETGHVVLNNQTKFFRASQAAVTTVRRPDDSYQLVLAFSPNWMLSPNISEQKRYLVIWHEYMHIRQIEEKRFPVEYFALENSADEMTAEEARCNFMGEIEAYESECILADEINARDVVDICRSYYTAHRRGLRRAYAELLLDLKPSFKPQRDLIRSLADESDNVYDKRIDCRQP
ncbi:hypothetical protein ACFL3E_00915 [Patescibacteria group bacterium]